MNRPNRTTNGRTIFFLQADVGIRAGHVTGVQTCALPISAVVDDGNPFTTKCDAAAGVTAIELCDPLIEPSDAVIDQVPTVSSVTENWWTPLSADTPVVNVCADPGTTAWGSVLVIDKIGRASCRE